MSKVEPSYETKIKALKKALEALEELSHQADVIRNLGLALDVTKLSDLGEEILSDLKYQLLVKFQSERKKVKPKHV